MVTISCTAIILKTSASLDIFPALRRRCLAINCFRPQISQGEVLSRWTLLLYGRKRKHRHLVHVRLQASYKKWGRSHFPSNCVITDNFFCEGKRTSDPSQSVRQRRKGGRRGRGRWHGNHASFLSRSDLKTLFAALFLPMSHWCQMLLDRGDCPR